MTSTTSSRAIVRSAPEDVQALAKYVLGHRVLLGPHAASHGVSVDMVIDDVVARVPVP